MKAMPCAYFLRGALIASCIALLPALAVFCGGCRAMEEADDEAKMNDDNPPKHANTHRAPLLGYSIDYDAPAKTYRLLRHNDEETDPPAEQRRAPVVVQTGTLDECQAALIAGLKEKYGTGHPNLPFFTLGGKQFWADLFVYGDWRIQENVYTQHCRLLDPKDIRRAWGSYQACRVAFEEYRIERDLSLSSRHLVVLVHGIDRSKDIMTPMVDAIEDAVYETARINYPSTRRSLDEHAAQVEQLLNNLIDVDTVSFVTHSMGGLVIRKALSRKAEWRKRIKLGRVVMVAPPNQGARMAELLKGFLPYKLIYGPSGQSLVGDVAAGLPEPPCSFGIIAARRGDEDNDGYNPLIPGDDDGLVGVEETKLPGADDFTVVHANHVSVIKNTDAIKAIVSFLKTGKFDDRTENND